MGNNFLTDIEAKVWDPSNDDDFVTLFPRELEEDAFTKLLHGALLDIYHRALGHRKKVGSNLALLLYMDRKWNHGAAWLLIQELM